MNPSAIRASIASALFALMLLPTSPAFSQEQEYKAMEGVTSVRTAFDFRVGDAELALSHLNLIHSMLEDPALTIEGEQPEIVLVFIGPSVELVSTTKNAAATEAKASIAEKISEMDSDGVKFEICMTAAHALDVSADTILPEIVQVGNGWISLIGYQHNGYSMIADF